MTALDPILRAAVIAALHEHRIAKRAAEVTGVHTVTAWRIAQQQGIALISTAEHMKRKRRDPAFIARQKPAAAKASSQFLKRRRSDPAFRDKLAAAAQKTMKQRNADASFRRQSADRLRQRYDDPVFRKRQAKAASQAMRRYHNRKKASAEPGERT